ncbi:probable protein phosphatase CG10417 [Drosophila serrata]|uniref:probable protein phosphatase CG10417 n=1 Tax=Drosophila serrata TaxID=7274 RepID=UPI000A1D0E0B|nr:probable protein phosphatase CG10417 [Drosophila serrata]KAH8372547.1 hypothetical protein KR200_003693 [Drosophila serrata]
MGAYLSHPKTDKASTDEFNDFLAVGASSMQGWRNSQEDAHNSILNYNKNTSFFAVYDGHGGAEVAQYCADKFPEFLKNLESYRNGHFEKALKDAFLGFDKTLLDPSVVAILKILAGEHNFAEGDATDYDDDAEEDLAELQEESNLPLNEVLERYKGLPLTHGTLNLTSEGSVSKLQSPYLRGRRAAAVAAEAVNKAVMDPTAKPEGSSTSAAAATIAPAVIGPCSSYLERAIQLSVDESAVSSSSKSNNDSTHSVICKESSGKNADGSQTNKNGSVTSSRANATCKNNTNSMETVLFGSKVFGKGNLTGQSKEIDITGISSTSKESKDFLKKFDCIQDDDTSTDDDVDYKENDPVESPNILGTDSSDDDIDDEVENIDGDEEDDEEDEISDEEETDEDQKANDHFCANMIEEPGKDSGCTAVVCLLHGRDLYVANAGDSRCVISRNGRVIEMSIDHKPEDDEEAARIIKAGGRVTLDGRVNGGLNLSRALGDHAYKTNIQLPAESQMISALPDIRKLIITPEDEFMVLACDGIWNYMSSEEVISFVRLRLKEKNKKLSIICEELFDNCLAPNTMGDGTGCDNMTAVIVQFQKPLQDLQATINPIETEDAVANKYESCEKVAGAGVDRCVLKRCVSPDTVPDSNEIERNAVKTKRLKIEENKVKGVDPTIENLKEGKR